MKQNTTQNKTVFFLKKRDCLLIVALLFSFSSIAAVPPSTPDSLQTLLGDLSLQVEQINLQMTKEVHKAFDTHIGQDQEPPQMDYATRLLNQLQLQRSEVIAKRDLIHRLDHHIRIKKMNMSKKEDVVLALMQLATLEAQLTESDNAKVAFYLHLGRALRDSHEPKESIVGFIKDYSEYTSLKQPKTATEFVLERRHYTSGQASFPAPQLAIQKSDESNAATATDTSPDQEQLPTGELRLNLNSPTDQSPR